ncbi:MAG: PH domain-containing protein [Ruminococcus sp.]|nr:PH domain-containing protein [Ruminococcus sp.]
MEQKQYKTAPQAKYLLQGLTFLISLILCLLFFFLDMSKCATLLLSGGCLLVWIIIGLFYLPMSLDRIRITVTDSRITMDSGLFLIRSRSLLLRSLQLSSIIRTPFSQYTGLNFVPLHAYGGSLILPFLKRKDAQELYDTFTAYLLTRPSPDGAQTEDSHAS